jgi:hypothetical protein
VENIIVSGTHSHSAGMGGPRPGAAGGTQAPGAAPAGGRGGATQNAPLDDVIADAVRQAASKLQPARMGFGTGLSYLNVNRDVISPKTRLWTQDSNLNAPSDKTVAVMKFEGLDGAPIAIYMNYAMHPVNLYLGGITSADFPGAMSRFIEQIYGDKAVVEFTNGAEGDQNPLYLRASTAAMLRRGGQAYSGQPLIREEVEAEIRDKGRPTVPLDAKAADDIEKVIEAEGIILAEEVLRVADGIKATEDKLRIWGAEKTLTCPGRTRTNTGREGTPGTYAEGPDVHIGTGILGIGSVALAHVQGEVYNIVAQEFKAKSPMANVMFVGLANGTANSGYIPSDDAFGHNTFQVLGSRLRPGCAETGIQDTLLQLISDYQRGM